MYSRPADFPIGTIFGYEWLDNIYYYRGKNPKLEAGTADLSARKVVYINSEKISSTPIEDGVKETWVLLYRKKPNCDATGISLMCCIFVPLLIPFSIVYNALRIVGLPFLLLYHIGKAAYEIFNRMDTEKRSNGEIVWDHTIEWLDEVLSSITTIVDNLLWRLGSLLGHAFCFFEGLVVANPRIGRKMVARCESLANREISWLRSFQTEEWQRLAASRLNRSEGVSLDHSWWSVQGPMSKFEFLSSYHSFVVAGCYMPMAVGVLDEKGRVIKVRGDSGKLIGPTEEQEKQKKYTPFK